MIVTAAGLTALVAALVGTTVGVLSGSWLVDTQGASSGIGAGIVQLPPLPVLLTVIVGAVLGAVAAAALPA
ncbi:hypothetical protein ADK91_13525, partial [Streptomyces sp. XY511]